MGRAGGPVIGRSLVRIPAPRGGDELHVEVIGCENELFMLCGG